MIGALCGFHGYIPKALHLLFDDFRCKTFLAHQMITFAKAVLLYGGCIIVKRPA